VHQIDKFIYKLNVFESLLNILYIDVLQFYEACIEMMTPNMPTAIVSFPEYGNSEEVLLTDIRPYIPQVVSMEVDEKGRSFMTYDQ
jgi:hypothetical protein